MRVLFLTPDYPPRVRTGIGRYVQSIARGLAREGVEAHVLTSETDGGPPEEDDEGVHVYRRPVMHLPGVRKVMNAMPEGWQHHLPQQAMTRPGRRIGIGLTSLIEGWRIGADFDVVEAPDYFAPGWAMALSRRWPVVTMLHTPLEVEARYSNLPDYAYLRAACAIERIGTGMSTAISAPSNLIKSELISLGWSSVERSDISPIGVGVDEFPYRRETPDRGRILIVGHITPRKGHDILARAVGTLSAHRRDLEVVAVGSYGRGYWNGRPYREHLESEIARHEVKWTFLEHTDREALLEWYGRAAVVVVPSRFESFSMAAVEGMLAGRPVIVSDRCGLAEVCPHGAGYGLQTFPAEDAEALAHVIDDALDGSSSGRRLGIKARESALDAVDIRRSIPLRLELYRSVSLR